jgi:hypothetical protein
MYKYIVNPETGRKVNVFGRKGKQVLSNFLSQLGGTLGKLCKAGCGFSAGEKSDYCSVCARNAPPTDIEDEEPVVTSLILQEEPAETSLILQDDEVKEYANPLDYCNDLINTYRTQYFPVLKKSLSMPNWDDPLGPPTVALPGDGRTCPDNFSFIMTKNNNYIVVVGEVHASGSMMGEDLPDFTIAASNVVNKLKNKVDGYTRVAAVELPIIHSFDMNLDSITDFEAEDQKIIGSGAGRVVCENNQWERGKKGRNYDFGSLNHTIFNNKVRDDGVKIERAEDTEAHKLGTSSNARNSGASIRLNAIAKKHSNCIIFFPYGLSHLCNVDFRAQSADCCSIQEHLWKSGWTCLKGTPGPSVTDPTYTCSRP